MAQSTAGGPLASIYESRIGKATNANEVMGFWVFFAGIVIGFFGLVLFYMTTPATTFRGVGYALAALAPPLLMAGAVLRFPLRKMATTLVGVGLALAIAAVAWFVWVFPGGWSLTTGNSVVIISYIAGLAIIGIAGSIVPLATDRRDAALNAAEQRTETAEDATGVARDEAAVAKRESEAASNEREAVLQSEIAELRSALADSESENTEIQAEAAELQADQSDTEADEADLAVVLNDHWASESQFELYEDRGGAWRWRLRHRNGNIIGVGGEGYTQKHNAQKGMQAVRRDALGATVLLIEDEADLPATDEEFEPVEEVASRADFEVYEDAAGKHRWRLRHDNGDIIADSSQMYASRDGVENAIDGLRGYVGPANYLWPDPTAIEVYLDQAGEWRWRLVHRNGNILADSGEGYSNRSGVRRAIDRIRNGIDDMDIEVYEDNAGEFRWRLLGGNNQIMADSGEGYGARNGAEEAVERVREYMPEANLLDINHAAFEVYEDKAGEFRWRLRHRNGRIMADSGQGYSDRSGARDGIESVKVNAPNAEVEISHD